MMDVQMRNSEQAVKAGIGYTIGNFFVKGIVFLSLPLFSRIMTTEQFGVFNVFISYESILYVLVGLALHLSLQNANIDYKSQINKYISSVSLIYILNSLLFCVLATIANEWLSRVLDLDGKLLYVLIVYSFGTSIITLYNMKVSLNYEYKKYLFVTFAQSVGNILLSLVFILFIFTEQRDLGRILGATLAVFLTSLWILYSFYKEEKPVFVKEYWVYGLVYCLPLVPHGISQVLLAQFDRIMIRRIESDSAAGIYSLAANLKLPLAIITLSIITSWKTWFFREIEECNRTEIQKRAVQLLELFAILTIGMMLVSREIVLIFGGRQYDSGKYVIIPMLFDAFILFIYSVIVQSEYYKKKTTYIMLGTMIASGVNIIANYIFIHKYGFIAAAYTTLFSYFIYLLMHLIISYRAVHFSIIPIKSLLFFLCLITAVCVICFILIDNLFARWSIAFFTTGVLAIHLLKKSSFIKHKLNLRFF